MTTRLQFCPSGKYAYMSENHANQAARRLLRKFGYHRPYRCAECGMWHLTTRPFRPFRFTNSNRRPE
jgi:hypothetical protein